MDVKTFKAAVVLGEAEGDEGSVKAAFSIFHKVDEDGDIVLPSFFKNGQPIPMAAWGHAWGNLPPGKGVIRVQDDHASFDGRFFLNTTHGRDHYETVKAMGDLQEWSFGFKVTEHEYGTKDGQKVRFLKAGDTYEASPVLIGANRNTRTLAIKSALPLSDYGGEALIRFEEAVEDIEHYIVRLEERAGVRAKEGRRLSSQTRDLIASVLEAIDTLGPARERLATLFAETDRQTSEESEASGEGGSEGGKALATFFALQAELARSDIGV